MIRHDPNATNCDCPGCEGARRKREIASGAPLDEKRDNIPAMLRHMARQCGTTNLGGTEAKHTVAEHQTIHGSQKRV